MILKVVGGIKTFLSENVLKDFVEDLFLCLRAFPDGLSDFSLQEKIEIQIV